jgi:predicted nucleic acid-binding protein
LVYYWDASAVVKLVFGEAESATLAPWFTERRTRSTISDLGRTETLRTVRRLEPERQAAAFELLEQFAVSRIDRAIFDAAAGISGPLLRTLDAIHLAAAAKLGAELEAVVTYDKRMAAAAREAGFAVQAPGADV